MMKAAFKVAAGVDLEGLSEYLNAITPNGGDELPGRKEGSVMSEEALRSVVLGDEAAGAGMITESRSSYAALKAFWDKEANEQKANPKADYVDFRK